MNSQEIRQKYLKFFETKGHRVIPSASLVPANDPTVLFTTAGMHPLVPYLLGETHPQGTRLVNFQKCLRTDDIDEVGDDTHNTFFEMLGNWSLGDYWKQDSISWSYEFLTSPEWLGIDKSRLAVSVFEGDADAPFDSESVDIWKSLGIPEARIAKLGKKDNWWGPPGATGPCGPDTEIFYWVGPEPAPETFDGTGKQWVEIWNNVFMQYSKTADGKFEPLKQKNVDTGMGLERITTALSGKSSIYDTDLFRQPFGMILRLGEGENQHAARVISDHVRASVFLLADGVVPSNKDRGYILRRLIRRALVLAETKNILEPARFKDLIEGVMNFYAPHYPELASAKDRIIDEFSKEQGKFEITLQNGLQVIEKKYPGLVAQQVNPGTKIEPFTVGKKISGKDAFDLYQSFGFPKEVIKELVKDRLYEFDEEGFDQELKKHQDLSRTSSAGMFKGGLASNSEVVVKLHTATHLLNAALRKVLGSDVWQKGSNITEERARFDFTHGAKMTDDEKKQVEDLVNGWIARKLPVNREVMPQEEAKRLGAIGVFGEKYADEVSVYTVFDPATNEVISREFCGGPHVENTGSIGTVKIQKEEAVSAGVRRIKITTS